MQLLTHQTEIGSKRINQDASAVKNFGDVTLMVVCDGMGSYEAAELASQGVVDFIVENIQARLNDIQESPETELMNLLQAAKEHASQYIVDKINLAIPPYTTVVLALIFETEVIVANVGDSRAYLLFEENTLWRTKDHSVGQRLLDQGLITEEKMNDKGNRGLENHLAKDDFVIDITRHERNEGNLLVLLCSDGFSNAFTDSEMLNKMEQFLAFDNLDETLKKAVSGARQWGGEACDNITVALMVYKANSTKLK